MSVRYGSTNLSQGSLFGITRQRPNSDPRDIFVDPYLTLMIDSFSCTLFCAKAWINNQFYFKLRHRFTSAILFWRHLIALLWRALASMLPVTSITTNIKHRVRTSGSDYYFWPCSRPRMYLYLIIRCARNNVLKWIIQRSYLKQEMYNSRFETTRVFGLGN